jgi:hypothetical protein
MATASSPGRTWDESATRAAGRFVACANVTREGGRSVIPRSTSVALLTHLLTSVHAV